MQWLKNLFREKKTFEQLKPWLDEQLNKQNSDKKQAIATAEHEFPEILIAAKRAVIALEQAELRNPNIPERAKHFMQGNREQFLKLTNRFIENLFVPKEAADFSQIGVLFYQYAQNTARPAAILSEFIGDEVSGVRKSISDIEKRIHDIKKTQVEIEAFQKIQDILARIENVKKERESLEKQRVDFEQQLQQLRVVYGNLRKEKEDFINKPEYLKVKEDLVSAAKERQEAEQAITTLFLPLSDAIKKYAHDAKHEKIASYADNPLETLMKDYSFSIVKHVQAIREAITNGKIALKPEKTQKALESLIHLTKEELGPMLHRYARAKKNETDVHHDVAQRPVIQEYEQYAVSLKEKTAEIQQLETTVTKLTLPTDEQLKEELKQELEKHKIILI
jgi:hypothetical protein